MEDPAHESMVPTWLGVSIAAAIVAIFYFLVPGFGRDQLQSPLAWLGSAWNGETNLEHAYLVPIIMIGLFFWQRKTLKQAAGPSTWKALPILLIGAALFIISHRTGQARVAIAALPLLLWGGIWILWGWRVARLSFFPLFLLLLVIPHPQFQQNSIHLQILSNKLAHLGAGLCGVETEFRGTRIYSTDGSFPPLEIDRGCGGNQTLTYLILIASVWAYISSLTLWKKCLLVLAVVPIEIYCNALRLTSIFVISRYGDFEFARTTWHDWSGLFLVYPAALMLLFLTHALLQGRLPRLKCLLTRHLQAPIPEDGNPAISTKKPTLALSLLLGITLSSVFLLPQIKMTESAMSLEFPRTLGDWIVHTYPPSRVEIAILTHDSRVAKAACILDRHEQRSYITGEAPTDRADLSIVLSGHALAKQFHRPERALHVQGHQQLQISSSEITLKNGLTIPVRRILSNMKVDQSNDIEAITYSVFVGHSSITASHFQRTLIDLKDRVLHAEDQRWAYIQASMRYRDQPDPARGDPPNLESADRKLRDLLVELMENNPDWSLIDN